MTIGTLATEFRLAGHITAFPAVERDSGHVALTVDVWLAARLRTGIEVVLRAPELDAFFDTPVWTACGSLGGVVQIKGPGQVEFVGRGARVRFDDVQAGLARRFTVHHEWLPSLEHALRPWRDGAKHLDEPLPRGEAVQVTR